MIELAEAMSVKPLRMNSLWKSENDEILILSDADCNLSTIKLNKTASHVWLLCNGSNTVNDIINEVREHSTNAPSEETIAKDVISFLHSFHEKKLVAW